MTRATQEQIMAGTSVCWKAFEIADGRVFAVEWERGTPQPAVWDCIKGLRELREIAASPQQQADPKQIAIRVDHRGRKRWFALHCSIAHGAWSPEDSTGRKH